MSDVRKSGATTSDPSDEEIIALTRKKHLQRRIAALAYSIVIAIYSAICAVAVHRAGPHVPARLWAMAAGGLVVLAAIGFYVVQRLTRPPAEAYSERLVRKRADELQWQIRRFFLLVVPISVTLFAVFAEMNTISILDNGVTVTAIISIIPFLVFGLWVLSMMTPYGWRRSARTALDDELMRALRTRALTLGFWAVVPCMAAVFVLALFDRRLAIEAMVPILYLAVAVPALSYAYLDWRAGESHD